MDKYIDYLLDSNWLVTLSSILVTIYVFALGIPTLLQQTFMPEKLREIANHHFYFQKQIITLKRIGSLVILFLCFLGNPACKFFYYSFIKPKYQVYVFASMHIAGVVFFLLITFTIYNFFLKHILQKPEKLSSVSERRERWWFVRKHVIRTRKKQTIYLEILNATIDNIIASFSNKTSANLQQGLCIEDLVALAHVCEDNINRSRYINALQKVFTALIALDSYGGDTTQPIVKDVLVEEINRNFSAYSIENIKQIVLLSKIVINRYFEPGNNKKEINDFDLNEVKSLLLLLLRFLLSQLHKTSYEYVFIEAYDALKKISLNYYDCYLLQKTLFKQNEFKYLTTELINLITDKQKTDQYRLFYICAYISWLYTSSSESLICFSKKQFEELMLNGKINKDLIENAIQFFSKREEYTTMDSISKLLEQV